MALGKQKADVTIELTEHILIDITNDGKLVGLEILDASEEISKIFGRIVSKEEIQKLLCDVKQESANEYLIGFKSPDKKESATLLIPLYQRPLVASV